MGWEKTGGEGGMKWDKDTRTEIAWTYALRVGWWRWVFLEKGQASLQEIKEESTLVTLGVA